MANKLEKETIINFNEAEKMVSVYSASPGIWAKCERRGYKLVNVEKFQNGKTASKEYECAKKCVSLRKYKEKRVLTDEEREKYRVRMENVRRTGKLQGKKDGNGIGLENKENNETTPDVG